MLISITLISIIFIGVMSRGVFWEAAILGESIARAVTTHFSEILHANLVQSMISGGYVFDSSMGMPTMLR